MGSNPDATQGPEPATQGAEPATQAPAPAAPGHAACGGTASRVRERIVAAALLAMLAARFAVLARGAGSRTTLLAACLAALALGGCLWWVARRQFGAAGATLALALFAASSCGRAAPGGLQQTLAALGLFAMLYTAVGVAHALQGPPSKWKPRILLMAALTAFTSLVQPVACAAGLLLAGAAMLYLAENRRRVLLPLFALWVVAAALVLPLRHSPVLSWLPSPTGSAVLTGSAGVLAAAAVALGAWAVHQRSRYFGNTGPLLVTMVLAGLCFRAGQQTLVWALPFALLFTAGVFADELEGPRRRFWVSTAVLLCVLQIAAFLH